MVKLILLLFYIPTISYSLGLQKDDFYAPGSKYVGMTIIDWVAEDNIEEVKVYLNRGVNINYESQSGSTPLKQAIINNNYEIIDFLLENGADINHNHFGTPIETAISSGNPQMVSYIIDKGINVSNTNYIIDAVTKNNYEVTKLLLDKGTPPAGIIIAAKNGYYEIAKLLIERGVDVNEMSDFVSPGYYPIELASTYDHCNIANLLFKNGAIIRVLGYDIHNGVPSPSITYSFCNTSEDLMKYTSDEHNIPYY